MLSCGHAGTTQSPLRKCAKHAPGSPFSTDLDCKRCASYAFGKLNGKKFRQSLDTTDRQEAASKLLQIEAEAKAPFKYSVADAAKRFLAERENSGHQRKSILRYQDRLERLMTFLAGRGITQLRAVRVDDLSDWKATWSSQNLLLDSLKRLSEEFEQREKRMAALCGECVASFDEQSTALRERCDEVSKRLDDLTQRLATLTAQLAVLHPSWPGK